MRALAGALLFVAASSAALRSSGAQVFQVQGGGSSLFEGYGGLVNIWGNGYEASLGIGYLDGVKIGASARRLLAGRDTLRLGNDLLPFSLDTDVFSSGGTIFAQGASLQARRGRSQLWAFGGASASALSAPYFSAQKPRSAMFYARGRHDVSRELSLAGHLVITDRQSLIGSASWEPSLGIVASASAGIGSNNPYAAIALDASRPRWDVRAAAIGMGRAFRRTSAPMPLQSEMDGENVLVAWKPREGWSIGIGRQHFRQDSSFRDIPTRATLNQLTMTGRSRGTSFSGGWLISEAGRIPNVSSYLSLRREVVRWLHSEMYLLRVWEPAQARLTTPVVLLREILGPRLSLLQTISREQGRTTVNFGGTLNSGLSSISVDYQVAHSPYLTAAPFVQTMGVNGRLQLGRFGFSFGSFVTPDGRVHYSAQGNTFLYNGTAGGSAAGSVEGRIDRYVTSGVVVDENGNGVDGAALQIDRDVVYTDSRGRFFARRPTGRQVALKVIPGDFLAVGDWEVVEAPASLTPVRDGTPGPVVKIVVRRVARTLRGPGGGGAARD
ncbi:MAG: hypothetical protein ACT4OZ_06765 [Gemmatimonadota bacterium]